MIAVLATLGYVLSPDGREVLMIRREGRPDDLHLGKYNGLGGKLEPDEDVCTGMRREIREEAGIECTRLELAGTVSWPGFGPGRAGPGLTSAARREGIASGAPGPRERSERQELGRDDEAWFGFLFRVPAWTGTPLERNPEGTLVWTPVADVLDGKVPMWAGDRHFLPLVFAARPRQFHGVMPWSDGRPVSWSYTEL